MQIRVSSSLAVALEAPEDLKSFKVVVEAPRSALAAVTAALARVATVEDAGKAWVLERWIREASSLSADPDWQAGVGKMIDYARKHGWVDDAHGTIRAHIEWQEGGVT